MSEKKDKIELNEDELNKVAGGTYEEDGTTEKLYVGAHVEIYYKWGLYTRSFGGTITGIRKNHSGAWFYYVDMTDDPEYSGWYTEQSIFTTFSSSSVVMTARCSDPDELQG